jgi:hypothetical protein
MQDQGISHDEYTAMVSLAHKINKKVIGFISLKRAPEARKKS